MLDGIPSQPGSYLLVFSADQPASITVGRLGRLSLDSGYYFYSGSAFGPGGVRARVRHHSRISTRPHWHLDYIRPALVLREVWYSIEAVQYEHDWAAVLYYTLGMQVPLRRLGATDCRCASHFFYVKDKPGQATLLKALQQNTNIINLSILDII